MAQAQSLLAGLWKREDGGPPMFVFPKETPRVGRSIPRYRRAMEDQGSRLLYLSIIVAHFCSGVRFGVCLDQTH